MIIQLGKTSRDSAVAFCDDNPDAILGSLTISGLRRVATNATGENLTRVRAEFAKIVIGDANAPAESVVLQNITPPSCIHRGSQRKTCCGSPDMWICRELKTDCVASSVDAANLRRMVATTEAASIAVCETCPHRKTNQRVTNPRVGFVSAAYMPIGGTETFHRSLLPRLKQIVNIAGFTATAFHGGGGSLLHVPYSTGVESARNLAANCDILVVWGIHDLVKILPVNRPKVIAVHHSDWSSDWNNNLILNQLDTIDEVICVNENTSTQLASYGKTTHYIPNAINPRRVTPSGKQSELRAQFSIPEESKIVLFGHRLSTEKRPKLAVEIARKLPQGWMMVIAGDGPQRDLAADCDRVRVVGAVESLADWLAISDCFLSLSTFEGFGLSICEAMAAGVPTVSTPAGIAPGLATTLPTDSTAAEWADAIVTAKAIVTPAEILDRFSVQRMVDSWASVIKGLQ